MFGFLKKLIKKNQVLHASCISTKIFLIKLRCKIIQLYRKFCFKGYPNHLEYTQFGPIILNLNDQHIGAAILRGNYWDSESILVIEKLLNLRNKKNLIFYDVGANIGTHTLPIAKMFGSRIKVRAFEAQKPVYYMLCGTIAINNLNNVTCHYNAVSNTSEEFIRVALPDYEKSNNFGGLELLPPVNSDNSTMKMSDSFELVKSICLDSFNEDVDLIKIDIEGMENIALQGAKNIIKHARPFCIVEMIKTDVAFVQDFFKELDYVSIDKHPDNVFVPIEYLSAVKSINLL